MAGPLPSIHPPPVVGSSKDLDNNLPLSSPELAAFITNGQAIATQLAEGVPPGTPATIPVGSLVRVVVTLKKYHALVKRMADLLEKAEKGEDPGQGFEAIAQDAKALLTAPPPAPAQPKSRLILPK